MYLSLLGCCMISPELHLVEGSKNGGHAGSGGCSAGRGGGSRRLLQQAAGATRGRGWRGRRARPRSPCRASPSSCTQQPCMVSMGILSLTAPVVYHPNAQIKVACLLRDGVAGHSNRSSHFIRQEVAKVTPEHERHDKLSHCHTNLAQGICSKASQ